MQFASLINIISHFFFLFSATILSTPYLSCDAKVEMRQSSLRRVFHFRGSLLGRVQGDREPVSLYGRLSLFIFSLEFGFVDNTHQQLSCFYLDLGNGNSNCYVLTYHPHLLDLELFFLSCVKNKIISLQQFYIFSVRMFSYICFSINICY